ncbi:YitT family protein [Pelotomaculum propionicicum]|uniref:YitT family protein n=1 Tax=Pelotomaculum propionicicum TaxID=258475 RepID=UPI003B775A32
MPEIMKETGKTGTNFAAMLRTAFKIIKKLLGISAGAALIAVAFNAFVIPYGLLSGGVSGLALMGSYLYKFPVYLGIFVLNIPIFLWGLKELQWKLMLYSGVGTAVVIAALPLSAPYIPVPALDLFLASVFSGVVGGIGSGIIFKLGASAGGTDIAAIIMKKKRNISVGATNFYCNIAVLALSTFFFDLKIALYTAISMWVGARITDSVIEGFNRNKSVTIISDRSSEIAERIMNEIDRGVTYLEGQGAYTGEPKRLINCVVSHYEIAKLKEIVLDVDRDAFIFITETVEVMGKGFTM